MRQLDYILKYPIPSVAVFMTLLPIFILAYGKYYKHEIVKYFFYYLASKLLLDLTGLYLASYSHNTLWLCNLYVLSNFVFISLMIYNIFIDNNRRKIVKYSSLIFISLFIFDVFNSNANILDIHNHRFVSFSAPLSSGILIFFCLMFFNELIKELYIDSLQKSVIFWIMCGTLIYNCACVFTTTLFNICFRWNMNHGMYMILDIPYIFESIYMIIVSIGFIFNKRLDK